MPKQSSRKKSPNNLILTARQQARLALLQQYEALHRAWSQELQNDSTDWTQLFRLYYKLAELEQRHRWLKKEALA